MSMMTNNLPNAFFSLCLQAMEERMTVLFYLLVYFSIGPIFHMKLAFGYFIRYQYLEKKNIPSIN